MNRYYELWNRLLADHTDRFSEEPLLNQLSHHWRNRDSLNIFDFGLSTRFSLEMIRPALARNLNWTFFQPDFRDTATLVDELNSFAESHHLAFKEQDDRYTMSGEQISWTFTLRSIDISEPFEISELSRAHAFLIGFELCDLSESYFRSIVQSCSESHTPLFLGPMYDGNCSWRPANSDDSHVLDLFDQVMAEEWATGEPMGVYGPSQAIDLLTIEDFFVRETEQSIRLSSQRERGVTMLVTTMRNRISESNHNDERVQQWADQRLYLAAGDKLEVQLGFRTIFALPAKR